MDLVRWPPAVAKLPWAHNVNLKRGLPTFVDKTTAGSLQQALAMYRLARRKKAPIFSASALQYTREIPEARERIEELGKVLAAVAASPNELVFYGIHGLAMLWSVLGPGIESVRNVGQAGLDVVRYRWRDGRVGVQLGLEQGRPGWRVTVFAELGKLDIEVADADCFYWNLQSRFIEMVRTRVQPLTNRDMLEIIRALNLAKKSKADGGVELAL
jgi:predicted dehydrogenase